MYALYHEVKHFNFVLYTGEFILLIIVRVVTICYYLICTNIECSK
jgi:hypothetical protein